MQPESQAINLDGSPDVAFRAQSKKLWTSIQSGFDWRGLPGRGGVTFGGLQRLALRACILSGETLHRIVPISQADQFQRDIPVPLALQMIDAARLSDQTHPPGGTEVPSGHMVYRGIELDADGKRVAPGTDFNYLATDTHVLSAALRGAYGKRYADIVQEKLWSPAGFTGPANWSKHAEGDAGVNFGHCCLQARLLDFAHLGQLYLDDLKLDGKPLTPKGWANLVTHPSAPFQEPGDKPRGYAMQFWVPNGYKDEALAMGAFGQILWVDRRRKVVVAQIAANPDKTPSEAEENAVFRAIVTAATRR
jgi:hypothetical protein